MPLIGPEGKEQLKLISKYGGVGFELAASIAIGYFGGGFLDGKFHTAPWLTYLGIFAGFGSAIKAIYRLIKTTDLDKL